MKTENTISWQAGRLRPLFAALFLATASLIGCGKNDNNSLTNSLLALVGQNKDTGELKITFHDAPPVTGTIAKIDMNVIETQIVDFENNILTVSSETQKFDLLQVTQNNPVVLAHGSVPAGTYKQIRLILDGNTTLTLADGSVHPLKVPSGQQSGLKIDGIFTVPKDKFYTLDIDLNPAQSVHFTPGQGYIMRPVIALTGADVLYGNFYYSSKYQNDEYIVNINSDASFRAKYRKHPGYELHGTYIYDGINKKFELYNDTVTSSSGKSYAVSSIPDLPGTMNFDVVTFAVDYIDLKDAVGVPQHLTRVAGFEFQQAVLAKSFQLEINAPNKSPNYLVGELLPVDKTGSGFTSIAQVDANGVATFEYSIPFEEFGGLSKDYLLYIVETDSVAGVKIDSDGNVISIVNIVSNNGNRIKFLRIIRDTLAQVPIGLNY